MGLEEEERMIITLLKIINLMATCFSAGVAIGQYFAGDMRTREKNKKGTAVMLVASAVPLANLAVAFAFILDKRKEADVNGKNAGRAL